MVAAMRVHPHVAAVQEIGCIALIELCGGTSPLAHRQRAIDAGGRTVVVAAMQAHPDDAEVQWIYGRRALNCFEVPTPTPRYRGRPSGFVAGISHAAARPYAC